MGRYVLIVVEGVHDEAFLGNLLKRQGFEALTKISDLPDFWKPLVPKSFPFEGDLRKRVPCPFFYLRGTDSVAICCASSESAISSQVQDSLGVLKGSPHALGVFLDADHQKSPIERHNAIRDELGGTILLPEVPGVVRGAPRAGLFVFPDNESQGTLEGVLEDCAKVAYPTAYKQAEIYLSNAVPSEFSQRELKEFRKPAGRKKALIAVVAAIMRPGKAVQTSLADNRWVSDETSGLPLVAPVAGFLKELFD